jgi:hypothetical protein
MTPESHTIYSVLLFCALVALQHWADRRHRVCRHFREGAAVTMTNGLLTQEPARAGGLVYCSLRSIDSRSARNQSSQAEPPWYPRASQ